VSEYRKIRLTELGWDTDLVLEPQPEPPPEPDGDQVLVSVEACGVCHRDLVDRRGGFGFMPLPITPGHEVAGRVMATGEDVTDWEVGDRVGTMHRDFCGACPACEAGQTSLCQNGLAVPGLVIDGGYASHILAPQRCFFRLPDGIGAAEAAVLHCTFGTAYRGLRGSGEVTPGRHVLVTGANGGVGTAAVQVAKRLGARVTAVVRSEAHADLVKSLGAEVVLVNPGDSFHKSLMGDPVDVAMDCVGPPTFNASLRSLRPGGRIVVVGNVNADKAALNLGYVVVKGLRIFGSSGATRADMHEVLDLHAKEPFHIQIEEQLGLEHADHAQRRVLAGGLQGRLVLVP